MWQEIVAVFRWDPPTSPNGVIRNYKIDCWLQNSDLQVCKDTNIPASTLEFTVPEIPENSTIYFTVCFLSEEKLIILLYTMY